MYTRTYSFLVVFLLFSSISFADHPSIKNFVNTSGLRTGEYIASENSSEHCLQGTLEVNETKLGLAILIGGRVLASFISSKPYHESLHERGCKIILSTTWEKNKIQAMQRKNCSSNNKYSVSKQILISKDKVYYQMTSNINAKITMSKCSLVRKL